MNTQSQPIQKSDARYKIKYQSEAMQEVIDRAELLARIDLPVLIQGEVGTGKGLVAGLIHSASSRHPTKLIKHNASTISEENFADELSKHCDGTILLKNVNHLTPRSQSLLYDLLESNANLNTVAQSSPSNLCVFTPSANEPSLNESPTSNLNGLRLLATTNVNLGEQVRKGEFRADLYYMLNQLVLDIPPLRDHSEDVPLLANHFMAQTRFQLQTNLQGFSREALQYLCGYYWPGNALELKSRIVSACVSASKPIIELRDIPTLEAPLTENSREFPDELINRKLQEVEKVAILYSLRKNHGNQKVTAERLGISSRTLRERLKTYGVKKFTRSVG